MGAAGAMVAIRQIAATEKGATIVFYFTLAGTVLGAVGSAFHWVTPDPLTLAMLILGGLIGGVGQLLLTEALRVAPVGVVAPFDYIAADLGDGHRLPGLGRAAASGHHRRRARRGGQRRLHPAPRDAPLPHERMIASITLELRRVDRATPREDFSRTPVCGSIRLLGEHGATLMKWLIVGAALTATLAFSNAANAAVTVIGGGLARSLLQRRDHRQVRAQVRGYLHPGPGRRDADRPRPGRHLSSTAAS